MFKGPNGQELAVLSIQKNWRRYKAQSAYEQLKFLMKKAVIIQRRFRLYQMAKATKVKIEELNSESLNVWREMMEEFKKRWNLIKKKRRVEIHINSYSVGELK
jgi:IQ domain-containing protein H